MESPWKRMQIEGKCVRPWELIARGRLEMVKINNETLEVQRMRFYLFKVWFNGVSRV